MIQAKVSLYLLGCTLILPGAWLVTNTSLGIYLQATPLGIALNWNQAGNPPGYLLGLVGVVYWVSLLTALALRRDRLVYRHLWVLPIVMLGPWIGPLVLLTVAAPGLLVLVWYRSRQELNPISQMRWPIMAHTFAFLAMLVLTIAAIGFT